jgi:hypothetical protein
VRLTTLSRFRVAVTVTLALVTFGCANGGSELAGPGAGRPSLAVGSDSSATPAEGDSSGVAQDDSTVVAAPDEDGGIVAAPPDADDSTVVAPPDAEGYDPRSGYVVAY